jgi:hypothetical protein
VGSRLSAPSPQEKRFAAHIEGLANAAGHEDRHADLVTPGSYFIMEDTNIVPEGPRVAVDRFLAEHSEFEVDHTREKFFLTFNPHGFMRKRNPCVTMDRPLRAEG